MKTKDVKLISKDYVVECFAMATSAYVMGTEMSFADAIELTKKLSLITDMVIDFMFTEEIEDKKIRDQVLKIKNKFKGDNDSDNN